MTQIIIEKVLDSVPQPYSPNTISFVKKDNKVSAFVSDNLGTTLHAFNTGTKVAINGPLQLAKSFGLTPQDGVSIGTYQITNFDSNTIYDIIAISGSVVRNLDTILYTAPMVVGNSGFIINGDLYQINIIDPIVNKPVITLPVQNFVSENTFLDLYCTAFSSSNNLDTFEGADWQVSTDINFTNIVTSVINSVPNETQLPIGNLPRGSNYYVRVRHKGVSLGYSEWSNTLTFSISLTGPTFELGIIKGTNLSNDSFGYVVEVSPDGTKAFISALNDNNGDTNAGVVYVYNIINNTLTKTIELNNITSFTGDYFGNALASSNDGNILLVAHSKSNHSGLNNVGAVAIYTYNGSYWTQVQVLINPILVPNNSYYANHYFGNDVAISGDGNTIAISCLSDNSNIGGIYVYKFTGAVWVFDTNLIPVNSLSGFGTSYQIAVSGDGNRIVAVTGLGNGNISFCVVYKKTNNVWSEEAVPLSGAQFGNELGDGFDVDINASGDTIAVGCCYLKHQVPIPPGDVKIYTRVGSVWTLQATLLCNSPGDNVYFGSVVKLSSDGNTVLISNKNRNYNNHVSAGSVYKFSRIGDTWSQEVLLTPIAAIDNSNFGTSVSLNAIADLCLIGSNNDYNNLLAGGSAYLFSL